MSRLSSQWDIRNFASAPLRTEETPKPGECWYCRKDLRGMLSQVNTCPLCTQTVCSQHFQSQRTLLGTLAKVCEACYLDSFRTVVRDESRKEAARLEERANKVKAENDLMTRQSAEKTALIALLEAELKSETEQYEVLKADLAQRSQAEEARGLKLRQACDLVHKSIEELSNEEKDLNERYLSADKQQQDLRSELSELRKNKNEAVFNAEQLSRGFEALINKRDLLEVVCVSCRNQLSRCCCPTPTGAHSVDLTKAQGLTHDLASGNKA